MEGVVALGALSLVAVTVALPAATAVSVTVAPVDELTELGALTANTVGSLDSQFTVRSLRTLPLPSLGLAVSVCVPPTTIAVVGNESVTEATGGGMTVIVGVGLELTVSLVAVIVAVPTLTAVTVACEPLALTVRTAVLLDAQVITRPLRT